MKFHRFAVYIQHCCPFIFSDHYTQNLKAFYRRLELKNSVLSHYAYVLFCFEISEDRYSDKELFFSAYENSVDSPGD